MENTLRAVGNKGTISTQDSVYLYILNSCVKIFGNSLAYSHVIRFFDLTNTYICYSKNTKCIYIVRTHIIFLIK